MVNTEVKQRKQRAQAAAPQPPATEQIIHLSEPVAPVAPVVAPVDEAAIKMTPRQKSRAKLTGQISKLVGLNEQVGPMLKDKSLPTAHKEWIKEASKLIENVERCAKRDLKPKLVEKRTNTTQSGILKKVAIAPEMCEFAGWPCDSLHSHVEISQELLKYIKTNNLQNAEKRKEILPDAKLAQLLKYNPEMDAPLDYNKVQQLISRLIV